MIAAPQAARAEDPIKLGLGGYMEQWVGYSAQDDVVGTDTSGIGQLSDTEVFFVGSTTLDNGLKIGVNIQLEGNTSGDQIDESYLTIGGDWGTVYLGDENSAQYKMQYSAPDNGIGANSGDETAWASFSGVGGTTGMFRGAFGSTFVEASRANDVFRISYFSPRFSGFQFGGSYSPDRAEDGGGSYDRDAVLHDGFSFGANFVESFNGVDVAVSGGYGRFDNPTGTDPEAWNAGVSIGFSGFTIGGSYAHAEADAAVGDMDGFDVGVAYGTGPWGVSLIWFHGTRDGSGGATCTPCEADHDTVHGSVSYAVGPGIKFVGTIGHTSIDDESTGGVGQDNDSTYVVVGPRLSF
jgi:predicted porin